MTTNYSFSNVFVAVLGVIIVKCVKESLSVIELRQSDGACFLYMESNFRILSVGLLKVSDSFSCKKEVLKGDNIGSDVPTKGLNLNPGIGVLINKDIQNISILIPFEIFHCYFHITPVCGDEHQEITVGEVLEGD
jgi:hypothetical protein